MAPQRKRLQKEEHPAENGSQLLQALVELHKAVKGVGFYPEGHPYRGETMQRAFELLSALVGERELVLGINRQGFHINGVPLERNAMSHQLAYECFIRRIAGITFMRDLTPGDLEIFVRLLSADPQKAAGTGGFAKQLEGAGVRTLWVNEKDLAAIWAKRPGYGGTGQNGGEGSEGGEGLPLDDSWLKKVEQRNATDILRLMDLEQSDAHYQELGRELTEWFRADERKTPLLPVLEELLRQHADEEKSLQKREYALFTMGQLGEEGTAHLLFPLASRQCKERAQIHRVLAAMGGRAAEWLIQRICIAKEVFERKALAAALVAVGIPAVVPLVAMLKDGRWYVVRNMVTILGEIRSPDCILALKRPLYHDDIRVRKETIRALMKIGGEASVQLLLPLLNDHDVAVARNAILTLGHMRCREAVPALLKLLTRRDLLLKELEVKKEAAAALGRIGDRRVTAPMLKLMGAKGWTVPGKWQEFKVAVAASLGELGDEAALPLLSSLARGKGAVADACREALDAMERLSGGSDD